MGNHLQSNCREIYCRAVVGSGHAHYKSTHEVFPSERISHILGCWVINHQVEAEKHGNKVRLSGSYDINVWYAYDENQRTEVAKHTVRFQETVNVHAQDGGAKSSSWEIRVRTKQVPTCLKAQLCDDGKSVEVKVESEYYVEVIAEARLIVRVCKNDDDDDFEGNGEDDGDCE